MFSLDRTNKTALGRWWWIVDRYLFASVLILLFMGLVLVSASSPAIAERMGSEPFFFVKRQTIFVVMALVVMVGISMLSTEQIKRFGLIGFGVTFLLLLLVPLVGTEIKGAARWIKLLGFTIQPSELMKPFFFVVSGWLLSQRTQQRNFPAYRLAIGLWAVVVMMLITQPDFGMTILFSIIWGAQLFLAGLPMLWVACAALFAAVGVVTAYYALPHVQLRIQSFLDPASGNHYQNEKALEAFVNGGLLGRGPGEGVIKDILPDAHTDFIFAVAGEELGLITCLFIVVIYAFIVIRGFMKLFGIKDLFTIYVTSGLLMLFGMQALINMGVSLNLLPNTGMTLPFMSYGGSSMLAMACTMGVILAMTRKRYGTIKRQYE